MLLKTVLIRFYRSFNFDYLRKYSPSGQSEEWEMMKGMWYPYVQIPIDSKITTVVGANESGKSHLLTAIEKGISGLDLNREDFCRYSQFFTVEEGQLKWPDFGFEWGSLSENDKAAVRDACGISETTTFDRFFLFRTGKENLEIYLPAGANFSRFPVPVEKAKGILKPLPHVFSIDAKVALPNSVPIRILADESLPDDKLEGLGRERRFDLVKSIFDLHSYFASSQTVTNAAAQISSTLSPLLSGSVSAEPLAEFRLARDLIRKVARIDSEALSNLYDALRRGHEGYANGIISEINSALAASLNFPRWWVQDRDFALVVSPREYDLVFTIRDKTETEYSFTERSSGLRYFLSYYVQYLAHEAKGETEILLMDEPDAYLSSQAQQDLLKIFDAFANPDSSRRPTQVIYVTHSPFLIDKNHNERIRVLEKGVGDEGTRIVRDASKNHYEPLRSAFGAFVGETTFIGNCNLMVEGSADQILLAGASLWLQGKGVTELETMDLNHVTIVPAGSASHIPYMVYLARGRDIEKPAVMVLLDSDGSGDQARKELLRGGPRRKQLLDEKYILQLGQLQVTSDAARLSVASELIEVEDLVPLHLSAQACKTYLNEVCGAPQDVIDSITADFIKSKMSTSHSTFDAIEACFRELAGGEFHIEKVGFARTVIDNVLSANVLDPENQTALPDFEENMRVLFKHLAQIQRAAERETTVERVSQRVNRAKASFLRDYPTQARRERALLLIEEIETVLDDSNESDYIKAGLQKLRRDFHLDDKVTLPVDDYPAFKDALERVRYTARIATQSPDTDLGIGSGSTDEPSTETPTTPSTEGVASDAKNGNSKATQKKASA
jgi:predicted ATPase